MDSDTTIVGDPPGTYLLARSAEPQGCTACTCSGLRGGELCRALAQSNLRGIRSPRKHAYAQNAIVLEKESTEGFTGVLRAGYLRREIVRKDGRRAILSLAYPGDVVGYMAGKAAPFSLEAATDAEICVFDSHTAQLMLSEDTGFRRFVVDEALRVHEDQMTELWRCGVLNAQERIVAFLATAAQRLPSEHLPDGSIIVHVPISRADWAALAATTVESICRTLVWLEETGLIKRLSTDRFRIHGLASLERAAGLDPDKDRTTHASAGMLLDPAKGMAAGITAG